MKGVIVLALKEMVIERFGIVFIMKMSKRQRNFC